MRMIALLIGFCNISEFSPSLPRSSPVWGEGANEVGGFDRIYIVATNDRDLKRRLRKIPGVPIMSCGNGKYVIERLPDAPEK